MTLSDSRLDSIAIRIGHSDQATAEPQLSGNLLPLLHEIRHALALLHESGTPTTLDLTALPFGPGDRDALLDFLGQGEVEARIDALGKTLIRESRFPGVWLLTYHAPDGAEIGLQLEITRMPGLLSTPKDDIEDALTAFGDQLDSFVDPARTDSSSRHFSPKETL